MTKFKVKTKINASLQTVFDISRDIDVHQKSASPTYEIAIAGVTSGLINYNETVTWRGKHFGFYLTHKSRITAMNLYYYFVDEMEEGKFKSFKHEHYFSNKNGVTTMKDKIHYIVPYGIIGKIFDFLFLKRHMVNFILERNKVLKELAEGSRN